MDKNYYEILGLSEDEITFFLSHNEESDNTEETIKIRDEIIKKAFEKRKSQIEEKYNLDLEKIEKDFDFKIQLIEYGRNINKNNEVNEARIKKSNETTRSQYSQDKETIKKQHEINIQQLELAYAQLKSEELRKKYNEQLSVESHEVEMKKISEDIEKKYRIAKYNRQDQYDPELLETINGGNLDGEKAVVRKPTTEPVIISLNDERNIKIKHTATVHYKNVTDVYNSYVNEYEITRIIDGNEKKDIVYTEFDLLRVGFNKKNNKLVDPNYYDCVVNKLLSEEAIEGSKFNGGYIGLVEQMPDGKFDTTINKDGNLSVDEQENLTAVMILKKREEQTQNNNNKKLEGEGR